MVYILLNASPSELSLVLTAESLDMVIKITKHDGCSSKDLFEKKHLGLGDFRFRFIVYRKRFPGGLKRP